MNGVLLLFVIAISIFSVASILLFSIRNNFMTGKSFRIPYQDRIAQSRFGQMLKKRNIDVQTLLHCQSIIEIENQLNNCHSCLKTAECDRVLEKERLSEIDFSFCPNNSVVSQSK